MDTVTYCFEHDAVAEIPAAEAETPQTAELTPERTLEAA